MIEQIADIVGRARALDHRHPRHDPARACDAYRRRLERSALRRPVTWLADPDEADRPDFDAERVHRALMLSGRAGPWAAAHPKAGPAHRGRAFREPFRPREAKDGAFEAAWRAWAEAAGWPCREGRGGRPLALAAESAAGWDRGMARAIGRAPGGSPAPDMPRTGAAPAVAWAAAWAECCAASAWDSTAAWDAGIAVACLNLPFATPLTDRIVDACAPMIDAFEAGAFAHALFGTELVVLAAPAIWTRHGLLHREDGPALAWPRTRIYAWRGVVVPEDCILRPRAITPERIASEADPGVRRALAEIWAGKAPSRILRVV